MADESYDPKVYMEQGGDRQVVASGGSLDVEPGGEIDIESGGALKLAGTAITSTAAEINILDGVTANKDELNKLDGAGAVVASGTQASKINDPSGGTTVDAEARTAINAIIDALEAFGISASA